VPPIPGRGEVPAPHPSTVGEPGRGPWRCRRARVLRFAKWPFILLAAFDAALGKRGPYTITSKARRTAGPRAILAPIHLATAVIVVSAALVGVARDANHSTGLIAAAGAVVLLSVIVSATELLDFPSPYDPRLLVTARKRRG
jgi:hypothetical protein